MLTASAVGRRFEPKSGQIKSYKIRICCFSANDAALRRKRKDWIDLNHDNVFEWNNMSIRGMLIQRTIQRRVHRERRLIYM